MRPDPFLAQHVAEVAAAKRRLDNARTQADLYAPGTEMRERCLELERRCQAELNARVSSLIFWFGATAAESEPIVPPYEPKGDLPDAF